MESRHTKHVVITSVVLLAAFFSQSCLIVPIKTKTQIQSPSGAKASLVHQPPTPGVTTRQQVEDAYHQFAVPSGSPNLHWSRFKRTGWIVLWAVGGYGAATGGANRVWNVHNIFVVFNPDDTVKSVVAFPEKEICDRIIEMHKQNVFPPLDLAQSVEFTGTRMFPGESILKLSLDRDALSLTGKQPHRVKPKHEPPDQTVRLTRAQVVSIRPYTAGEYLNQVAVQLKFSDKTVLGKSLVVNLEPPDVITLLRWFQQKSPASPGEHS